MIDQGIQRISREIERLKLQNARRTLKPRPELKWWLVYGPPRCGTTTRVQLDFAYKQATLGLKEYQTLVKMWAIA